MSGTRSNYFQIWCARKLFIHVCISMEIIEKMLKLRLKRKEKEKLF